MTTFCFDIREIFETYEQKLTKMILLTAYQGLILLVYSQFIQSSCTFNASFSIHICLNIHVSNINIDFDCSSKIENNAHVQWFYDLWLQKQYELDSFDMKEEKENVCLMHLCTMNHLKAKSLILRKKN